VSARQIDGWLRDLDADGFVVREMATEKLIRAGMAAVGPVAAAAPSGNLEVLTRGIHILKELALSQDGPTEEAARRALEDLAAPGVTAAARRAGAALASLDDIRQDRAIAELSRLGAKIERDPVPVGQRIVDDVRKIAIGERWRGAEEDLRRLSWLRDCQSLILTGRQVKDGWLRHVGEMKNLIKLSVSRASISDAALAHLSTLKNLQELDLRYVAVGDAALEHIQAHKSARAIKLYGTAVTKQGAKKLSEALPGATVDHRNGAFLGVGCRACLTGCEVIRVEAGSPAEKAGLRLHDVIIAYDGTKTADFPALTELIGVQRGGDAVTLEMLRGGELLSRKVTLGEWPDPED
jgi:hypothetical protein